MLFVSIDVPDESVSLLLEVLDLLPHFLDLLLLLVDVRAVDALNYGDRDHVVNAHLLLKIQHAISHQGSCVGGCRVHVLVPDCWLDLVGLRHHALGLSGLSILVHVDDVHVLLFVLRIIALGLVQGKRLIVEGVLLPFGRYLAARGQRRASPTLASKMC